MLAKGRIESLLSLIEVQAFRLSRIEAHPAFAALIKQEPDLTQALGAVRRLWSIFQQDVSQNDPLINSYIEQIEKSTNALSRDLNRLYEAFGFSDAVSQSRCLN